MDGVAEHAGVVDGDLLCKGCGYNLRTLPRDGRCPECHAPVAASEVHAREHPSALQRPERVAAAAGVLAVWSLVALVPVTLAVLPFHGATTYYLVTRYGAHLVDHLVGAVALPAVLVLLWNAGLRRPVGRGAMAAARMMAGVVVLAAVVEVWEGLYALRVMMHAWSPGPVYTWGFATEGQALAVVHTATDLVLTAGAWRYFWFMARARRSPVVAWMTTGLAATAVLLNLVMGGMALFDLVRLVAWRGSLPGGWLLWSYGVAGVLIVWNLVAGLVYWPLVARMAWRGGIVQ